MTVKLFTLPPLVTVAASVLYVAIQFDQLPERYPVHWGLSGQVDRWGHKDWVTILAPGLIGLAATGLVALQAWAMGNSRRMGRKAAWGMLALEWAVGALMALVVWLPVLGVMPGWGAQVMLLLPLAGVAAVLATMPAPGPGAAQAGPECWRWGVFYYNPADPDWVVARRSGMGYTLNFARREALWIMGALLLLLLAPLALLLRA